MQAAHPRAPDAVPTEKSASFVRNAAYLASLGHQGATRALQQLFLHPHTPVLDFTPESHNPDGDGRWRVDTRLRLHVAAPNALTPVLYPII